MKRRDESGAMAVIVGILAVVLFGVAALAVDLGNAWARERSVQKQVDISALSVGHLLPASDGDLPAIAMAAAAYLAGNSASGQEDVDAGELTNSVLADGEVRLQHANGLACSSDCVRLEVTAPRAHVDFGLAGVLGQSGLDVQRSASVQVFSAIPRGESVLPFWLPSGCALGPAMLDAAPGNSPGKFGRIEVDSSSADAADTGADTQTLPTDVEPGTHTIEGPMSPHAGWVGKEVAVRNLMVHDIPPNIDRASIRFVAPDGSWHEYAATDVGRSNPLVVPEFRLGLEVTSTPGRWRVYAVVRQKNDNRKPRISEDYETFTVNGVAPEASETPDEPELEPATGSGMTDEVIVEPTTAVGCVGQQRGNFGQLDSPRKAPEGTADALALNIAKGLDHVLAPYPFSTGEATVAKECTVGSTLIPNAQLDDQSRDGNNCITSLPGNRVSPLGPGFITGVGGTSGRVSADRGETTCFGRANRYWGDELLNDDVLSCFLREGFSLEDISQTAGVTTAMLDPAVVQSPRFVWLPVVSAVDRVQKGYQPIREFVPAFITDETSVSTQESTDASSANGIVLNGGGKQVQGIQVYVFNKDALPIEESAPTVAYDPVVGMKVARLVR